MLALVVAGVAAIAAWAGVARADTIPPFHVSGQVTDLSGAPLQNVHVILYRNTITPDANDPWFAADDEYTDIDGDYTLNYDTGYWGPPDQNDPGYEGTYAVLFWAPTVGVTTIYRPQWYDSAEGFFAQADIWQWDWQAQDIASSFAVSPTGIYKTGVDAVLEPYEGAIDCTVLDASTGLPLQNVTVTIFHYDKVTVGDTPVQENQVTTDANGQSTYPPTPRWRPTAGTPCCSMRAGYSKVWLGGVSYKAGVAEPAQSTGSGGDALPGRVERDHRRSPWISWRRRVFPCRAVSAAHPAHGTKLAFSTTLTPPRRGPQRHVETAPLAPRDEEDQRQEGLLWHLRSTLTMKASATGKLTASGKLAYAGKWEMRVSYRARRDAQPPRRR